jgi:hypothetical protein
MVTCLAIIKDELEGQLAGVLAKFKDLPEQLISFMYEEAGEDPHKGIEFIPLVSISLANAMTKKRIKATRVM